LAYERIPRKVCKRAADFLNQRNYIKIKETSMIVKQNEELKKFMINRRIIHLIFDQIKCD
jgi:hypothetical protein